MSQETTDTAPPDRILEEETGDAAAYAEIARQFGDLDSDEAAENTHDTDELTSDLEAEYAECKTACKTFQISGVISVQKLPPWVV